MSDSDSDNYDISDLKAQYVPGQNFDKIKNSFDKNDAKLNENSEESIDTKPKSKEELHRQQIEQLIQKASEGMEYQQADQKRKQSAKEKLENYKAKIKQAEQDEEKWEEICDKSESLVEKFKKEFRNDRTYIHVAVSWFYTSIEEKYDPKLCGKPVAIGDKNMIAHVNQSAAEYGIRKAIPIYVGKKVCPVLVNLSADFSKYRKVSEWLKNICKEYDPKTDSNGLDEMTLDITEFLKAHNLDNEMGKKFIATRLQKSIKNKLDLTTSIGIGTNQLIAKVC